MENIYNEIKNKLDLKTTLESFGLEFKKTGSSYQASCPFHEDKTPSFVVKDGAQHFKCYGECGTSGDIFTFLEKHLNLSKGDALKKAAEMARVTLKTSGRKRDTAGLDLTVRESIFLEAAKHYQANLPQGGGHEYFTKQRGHQEAVVNAMGLGWSTGKLLSHLRSKNFTEEQIQASGLVKVKKRNDEPVLVNGQPVLLDVFGNGLAIFPHWEGKKVVHFTEKDPRGKLKFQLAAEFRGKSWRFYHQDVLSKYNGVLVVEGEHDLLSVMDAGTTHVIGLIGQPAEYQRKALKAYGSAKHLYLWLDNDDPGKEYIRKICAELDGSTNVRIIVYDDKFGDPDEYLRAFTGDRRKEVNRLQAEALSYLAWEIAEIAGLEELEDRLKALRERKVFTAIGNMVQTEKLVYIEKLTRLGFPKDAIEEEIDINQDLKADLARYFQMVGKMKDADPNEIAAKIFKHFSVDGRFFREGDNVFLLYKHDIYPIGNNRPFCALIKKHSGLLPTKEPGRSVWESLASEAFNRGQRINLASWIKTDLITDTIFANLNLPNNKILQISPHSVKEIDNGINDAGVLLRSSQKILPLNFLPDADISKGMRLLKELLFDNLTCEVEQRYLILCWLFSAFLLDFAPYMALLKFSGGTRAGKTTWAKYLSLLLYGDEHLGDVSAPAAYSIAAQNPLLVIDNLESENMGRAILQFLLLAPVKGSKEKRAQGTDSGTVQEAPQALVCITSIEPFLKSELISRTFDIEFLEGFKSDSFVEGDIKAELEKNRDLIMSAIIKFISLDVLPNMKSRRDFIAVLRREHKGHSKNRTDEYLSLLLLMLEKLLKYIPLSAPEDFPYGEATDEKAIRRAWIEYQNVKAHDTELSSNTIIKLLDGLAREYLAKMNDFRKQEKSVVSGYEGFVWIWTHPEYLLEAVKTGTETVQDEKTGENYTVAYLDFVAASSDVVAAFDRHCKNNGTKNPYHTSAIFGARLRNDINMLGKSGWEVISSPGREPYFKIIRGQRYWKFRKILVR